MAARAAIMFLARLALVRFRKRSARALAAAEASTLGMRLAAAAAMPGSISNICGGNPYRRPRCPRNYWEYGRLLRLPWNRLAIIASACRNACGRFAGDDEQPRHLKRLREQALG